MDGFQKITGKCVPDRLFPFFWQHGEPHEILNKYMEKISESGMKGVCIEARPHPQFVQEGWWKDVDCILEKAKELDMKLWILDDSHFPTGYANGKIKEKYPQYLKQYLDMRRYDVQGPVKGARIDFSLLKGRPWDKPDFSEKILGVYMAKRVHQYTESGDSVQADTLTDITAGMDCDKRLLTVDIPAGAYSIFVVYQTRKGGEESTKDYLNPLISEATQVLVEEVYEPHYARYKEEFGKTILGFFSDEPRFGNVKGTEGKIGTEMVLPWREGLETLLGFEMKYLPLLWTMAEGTESKIRYQYMDVITRMYNENFTKVLGDWCREHGVWYLGHNIEDNGAHARLGYGTGHFFRGQQDMDFAGIDVIGGQIVPGMNYHHDAFNTGGSNGEFYHYALAKLGSSAAHLDPKKQGRVMCEAFGAYGWNEGLKMMKWIADHLLVRGVNWLVPHAFDPKEFPDFDCPPHFYAHGHNPQFRYFPVFSQYVNRLSGLFSDGMHPAKVGLLYPAELEWGGAYMPVEKPARVLTEQQISFDIVSLDYLELAELQTGVYCINGQCFEVLIVPYGEYLPEKLQKLLKELEQNQVKVLYLGNPNGCLQEKEISCKDLGKVLKDYKAVICQEAQPELAVGEYVQEDRKYYMLFNENIGEAADTHIKLKKNGYLYRYDAFADRIYPAAHEMHLHLEPYESAVFVETEQELECMDSGEMYCADENKSGQETILLSENKWKVKFADSFAYPNRTEDVPLNTLDCVQTLDGWENKTGTLRYETVLNLNTDFDSDDRKQWMLELGEVYETAEVFVNQKSAGVRLCRPYRFDLTGLLKQGENEIAIEVTNTLGTSMRDAISHYLVIEPFGVQGPVRLEQR